MVYNHLRGEADSSCYEPEEPTVQPCRTPVGTWAEVALLSSRLSPDVGKVSEEPVVADSSIKIADSCMSTAEGIPYTHEFDYEVLGNLAYFDGGGPVVLSFGTEGYAIGSTDKLTTASRFAHPSHVYVDKLITCYACYPFLLTIRVLTILSLLRRLGTVWLRSVVRSVVLSRAQRPATSTSARFTTVASVLLGTPVWVATSVA